MMDKFRVFKGMLRTFLDLLLIVFIIPPVFVFIYFFPLFFTGTNFAGLAKEMATLSFYVAWVSAPLLVASVLILKLMIRRKLKWLSVLLASYAAGFLWLLLWNWVIEDIFTLWHALIPLTVCCLFSLVYVMGKTLYRDDKINFTDHPNQDFLNPKQSEAVEKTTVPEDSVESEPQKHCVASHS